jgi:hypothetical protein
MDMELEERPSRRSRAIKSRMVSIGRGDELRPGGIGQPSQEWYRYDEEMNSVQEE